MKSLDDVDPNILIGYESGQYWQNRMDLMYYSYLDYIVRTLGKNAKSMIDIGTANCPYLEWFDWIPERVSFDMAEPYRSSTVEGIQGDFLTHDFGGKKYDVATCLQVLEHVPDVIPFARKLLEIESGICHINGPTVSDEAQMPFGGVKDSGYGRFGGKAAVDAFTSLRWVTIEDPDQHYPF